MQSKLAHAAERKAWGFAIDRVISAASGPQREKNLEKLIDMAGNLLKDTAPGATRGLRAGLYPGSKWEKFLFSLMDEVDHNIIKTMILNGAYESAFRGLRTCTENAEKYQCNVPWILLFDPTSACNKHCVGCWAAEYGNRMNLTFEEMDKLVSDAKALGTHLFMLTGGEPLVRKNDIIKLAEKHQDCVFNIFTNASLIDQPFCEDVRRVGNIAFSVSLEGFEDANDGRRGEGAFDEVMAAFDLMKKNKLIFGTSTAYTSKNYKAVTDDDFMDLLVEKGCRFAWFFHLMPVGAGADVDLMPTPEQREYVLNRIREIRGITGGKPIFAMDFQDDGEYVGGCIAGGRIYCHVNAAGDVEPCVFIHYSGANIREQSWIECLQQPLFQAYRAHWPFNDNLLKPCPMLENPGQIYMMVHESDAHSSDYAAPETVEELVERTVPYAEAWNETADRIWLSEHPTGKKVYADALSTVGVDDKAKLIAADDAAAEANLEELAADAEEMGAEFGDLEEGVEMAAAEEREAVHAMYRK